MSFIYRPYNVGGSVETYVTPDYIPQGLDSPPLKITLNFLLEKNEITILSN